MTMFPKAEVLISEDVYTNSRALMRILGVFGFFPFVATRHRSVVTLKWSPWLALYSYALGGLIIVSSCYIHIHDVFLSDGNSLDIVTKTDKMVGVIILSGYCIMAFCGVFIVPNKFRQLFAYLECIRQIDSIIGTTYTKSEKYRSVCLLFSLVAYNMVLQVNATSLDYAFSGDELGFLKAFRRNCNLAVLCHMIICADCVGRHAAYSLEKRLIQLNKILCAHRTKLAQTKKGGRLRVDIEAINKLNKVFLTLMDAAEILNNLFGLNNLVAVVSILFQLVVGPYFIILLLQGQRKGALELTLRFLILFLQIFRVLLITEPWHACMGRVDTTSSHVCKFLSLNLEPPYRKRVKAFAVSLCLRQMKFSALGLFNMDRFLFTSLVGTVTTYVVLLLQAQKNDIQ